MVIIQVRSMLWWSVTSRTRRSSCGCAPGHQQGVDDVAALFLVDGDGHKPDLLGEGKHALEDVPVGPGVPHDLTDVGIPHTDGEVESQEQPRAVDEVHQLARGEGGGVGRENGVLRGVPGRVAPEGLLDGQGLGDRLADEIGLTHRC